MQTALEAAEQVYREVVAELAGGIVQKPVPNQKICIHKLVNSELGAEYVFDTGAFFQLDGHEASQTDRDEVKRRTDQMQEALQKCAKELGR